jgi:hypothetical protein
MNWPWVSRVWYEAYLRERDRNDALVQQMIAMKQSGFEQPFAGQRVIKPTAEPEVMGLKRAESEFIDNAKHALIQREGLDPVTAEREAKRLRDEITDMQPRSG